jgi:hypothetical protein
VGGAELEGNEKPTENGTKAQTMRKLGFFICHPRQRGWHLHGSPVQAQKPADGENESFRNLETTNYKKEAGQGQTNIHQQKKREHSLHSNHLQSGAPHHHLPMPPMNLRRLWVQ